MKIGGHGLREHLHLLAPLFALIAAVWVLRMVLAALGAPHLVVHYCSVTVAGAFSILLAAVLIHLRGFGGYSNIAMAAFLLECWQQGLISLAIVFSILSGIQTIYTTPPYAGNEGPRVHILGHLTFGIGMGTIFGTAMGCLLLWLLRRMVPLGASPQRR